MFSILVHDMMYVSIEDEIVGRLFGHPKFTDVHDL